MVAAEEGFVTLEVYSESLDENIFFHPRWDVAIIRVRKSYLPRVVKVWMKNYSEINKECLLKCHACPNFGRDHSIPFELNYHPDDKHLVHCNSEIKNIHHYHGISGGGVYLADAPYMVSVISKYPFVDFEMNQLMLAQVDWDEINEMLYERQWQKLGRGASTKTRIAQDKTIIDLREMSVNGTRLNLDTALKNLRRDRIYAIKILSSTIFRAKMFVNITNSRKWKCYIFLRNLWCSVRPWSVILLIVCFTLLL